MSPNLLVTETVILKPAVTIVVVEPVLPKRTGLIPRTLCGSEAQAYISTLRVRRDLKPDREEIVKPSGETLKRMFTPVLEFHPAPLLRPCTG